MPIFTIIATIQVDVEADTAMEAAGEVDNLLPSSNRFHGPARLSVGAVVLDTYLIDTFTEQEWEARS